MELLNGKPLEAARAAALKIDGPPGFFLATDSSDAEFFALRRGQGAVVRVELSDLAMDQLRHAGMRQRTIPRGARSPLFAGDELIVPPAAFGLFNGLRARGQITVLPGP